MQPISIPSKTETGIDIADYITKKASGDVLLVKDLAGNFLYQTRSAVPDFTTSPPSFKTQTDTKNINTDSINAIMTELDAKQIELNTVRVNAQAILADMQAAGNA